MRCKALNVLFGPYVTCVDFFARGLHTRTAVTSLPYRQLGFLVKCWKTETIQSKTIC